MASVRNSRTQRNNETVPVARVSHQYETQPSILRQSYDLSLFRLVVFDTVRLLASARFRREDHLDHYDTSRLDRLSPAHL